MWPSWAYFVVYSALFGPFCLLLGPYGPNFVFVGLYWAHFVGYGIQLGLFYRYLDLSAAYFVVYKPFIGPIFSFMSPSLGLFCHLWAIQWAYFVFIGSRVKGRKPEACFTFGANFWASFNIIGPTYGPILGPKLAIYCHISNILFTAQCDCSGPIELILFWSMWKRFS